MGIGPGRGHGQRGIGLFFVELAARVETIEVQQRAEHQEIAAPGVSPRQMGLFEKSTTWPFSSRTSHHHGPLGGSVPPSRSPRPADPGVAGGASRRAGRNFAAG